MSTYFEEWLDPTLKFEPVDMTTSFFSLDFFAIEAYTSSIATTASSPEVEEQLPMMVFPLVVEKKFACHICSRCFARKHDLQRHIRVHTGAKPYSCLSCSKSFARTDALKRHLRMEEQCRQSPVIQAMKETGNRRYRNL